MGNIYMLLANSCVSVANPSRAAVKQQKQEAQVPYSSVSILHSSKSHQGDGPESSRIRVGGSLTMQETPQPGGAYFGTAPLHDETCHNFTVKMMTASAAY